jgi:hypothetical protein
MRAIPVFLALCAASPAMKGVNEFEKVQFVMKGGVVYKKDGTATAAW